MNPSLLQGGLHKTPAHTYLVLLPLIFAADGLLLWWLVTVHGVTEESAHLFTRYSARVSFIVFLPAFTASSLHSIFPSTFSAGLLRRRRQWGLSFAFAHTLHMFGIMVFNNMQGMWFTIDDAAALVIYGFIYLMALTSNNYAKRMLGSAWKVLHKLGVYAIFIGFAVTYMGRLGSYQVALDPADPIHEWYGVYLLLAVTVSLALLLRVAAFWKRRLSLQRDQGGADAREYAGSERPRPTMPANRG